MISRRRRYLSGRDNGTSVLGTSRHFAATGGVVTGYAAHTQRVWWCVRAKITRSAISVILSRGSRRSGQALRAWPGRSRVRPRHVEQRDSRSGQCAAGRPYAALDVGFWANNDSPPSDQPKSNPDQSWFLYYHLKNRRFMAIPMSATARLSLAMIVAPTEGNLKFPVKFPVSREFSDTKS
jgi:hypothetical protein